MLTKLLSLSGFLLLGLAPLYSQSFLAPNAALKSHETLDIMKIMLSLEKTEIYLQVENRIAGGNFCADKNIYIVYPDGTRILLTASNGIPVCPAAYKFREIGETLDFVLTFPPLKKGTGSINLIEDCQADCFSFYGIILDNDLNKTIDEAFTFAENDEPAKALVLFSKIAEENGSKNVGAEGLLYLNIIQLSAKTGNKVKAAEWYKKLESSGLAETQLYLRHLNSLGIKYE
jgi:hypothetical protein